MFGLFPVSEIFNKDHRKLNFKWLSPKTVFSISWILGGLAISYFEAVRLNRYFSVNAKSISGIVFYVSNVISGILFFKLATKWPHIVKFWCDKEEIFHDSRYTLSGWSLKKRVYLVLGVALVSSLSEHLLYFSSFLYDRYMQAQICEW